MIWRALLPGFIFMVMQPSLTKAAPWLPPHQETRVVSSVSYEYGSSLQFQAQITTPETILRATVFYRSQGLTADPVEATLEPSAPYLAFASIDLRAQPLTPFATIEYWWRVDFETGGTFETVPATFRYEDNRFEWRELSDASITVHWIDGAYEFGQAAWDITASALTVISQELALRLPASLDVYIYPNISQLQAGLRLGGRIWVGGHAEPELGVVLLAVPPGAQERDRLERDLPHELMHILLYERLGDRYSSLPVWLNEGLATLQESSPRPEYHLALQVAALNDRLLPLESLCAAFPFADADAHLAYAQSASFVQYLRDIYGVGGLVQLLDAYHEGTSCLGGVQRVYQRSLAQLQSEWERTLSQEHGAAPTLQAVQAWMAIGIPLVLLTGVGLLRMIQRNMRGTAPP